MKPIIADDNTLHCPVCDKELDFDGDLYCDYCGYSYTPTEEDVTCLQTSED